MIHYIIGSLLCVNRLQLFPRLYGESYEINALVCAFVAGSKEDLVRKGQRNMAMNIKN